MQPLEAAAKGAVTLILSWSFGFLIGLWFTGAPVFGGVVGTLVLILALWDMVAARKIGDS